MTKVTGPPGADGVMVGTGRRGVGAAAPRIGPRGVAGARVIAELPGAVPGALATAVAPGQAVRPGAAPPTVRGVEVARVEARPAARRDETIEVHDLVIAISTTAPSASVAGCWAASPPRPPERSPGCRLRRARRNRRHAAQAGQPGRLPELGRSPTRQ